MTDKPKEPEYQQYGKSHQAIQAILRTVDGNTFAVEALKELRTKIYEIIGDDDTLYKCRLYIQELDFSFRIGKREECHDELVINITDKCRKMYWLNPNKGWFKSWLKYYFSSKCKPLALENVK